MIKTVGADKQVWLVLPWRTLWGQNLLELRRLAHTATDNNVDLRLVCARAQVRMTAREAGIPPYAWLPIALRSSAQQLDGKGMPESVPTAVANLRRPRHLTLVGFGLALLASLLVLAVIAATLAIIMPSAEITLVPVTRHVASTFTATASPYRQELDYGQALLPARVVQVIFEEPYSMPTTGRTDSPDGYAAGEVVFANRTDAEVTIPKGTYVRTGSGETMRFYTVVEATVPAQYNATIRVPIMAVDAGPSSNVRALTINIIEGALATSLEVVNDAATSGGTMRQVPVVTVTDQNTLLQKATEDLDAMGLEKLAAELDANEFIVTSTFSSQVMSYGYDQAQDERSDVVSLHMKMVASATVVDGNDLEQLALRFVESQAGENLGLVDGTLSLEKGVQSAAKGGEVEFNVIASGEVAEEIDIDAIRRELRGKTEDEAAQWLSAQYDLAAAPQIEILPPQWERVPVLPARTEVHVEAGGL